MKYDHQGFLVPEDSIRVPDPTPLSEAEQASITVKTDSDMLISEVKSYHEHVVNTLTEAIESVEKGKTVTLKDVFERITGQEY